MTFEQLQQSIIQQLTEYANEHGVMVTDVNVEWYSTTDGQYRVIAVNTRTDTRS